MNPTIHRRIASGIALATLTLAVLAAVGVPPGLVPALAEFDAQAAPPAKPKAEAASPAKATVPFSMLPSNHMLVRAMINGKGPYRLIFDLGAPITLLGNRASETSGVVKAD